MFDNEHHQKIIKALSCLSTDIFNECNAYFGGGTLITLLHNEYRWSKDIDFICPVGSGYRRLREIIFDANFNAEVLFKDTESITLPRGMTADQYGVRFALRVDGTLIKFEIIAEGRIELEKPEFHSFSPSLPTLSAVDRFAEKLLANTDRWADRSVESRDLIDLGVLCATEGINYDAFTKAEAAYPVREPLLKSIDYFLTNREYQQKCLNTLQMIDSDVEVAIQGIEQLRDDLSSSPSPR